MQPQHKQDELWIENLITAFVFRAVLHCTKSADEPAFT